jgi:hypothetical protein
MILRRRDLAADPRTAALDVFAVARVLAGLGVARARLWVADASEGGDPLRDAAVRAWSAGIGVVTAAGGEAREAAVATAGAIGATVVDGPASLALADEPSATLDGRRLAARHALGLEPDEIVELVPGRLSARDIATRSIDFDARSAAEPGTRRRLILDGRPAPGTTISAELISAIVHPRVLVDLEGGDGEPMRLARLAADEVGDLV